MREGGGGGGERGEGSILQVYLKNETGRKKKKKLSLQGKKSPNNPQRSKITGYTHSFLC